MSAFAAAYYARKPLPAPKKRLRPSQGGTHTHGWDGSGIVVYEDRDGVQVRLYDDARDAFRVARAMRDFPQHVRLLGVERVQA